MSNRPRTSPNERENALPFTVHVGGAESIWRREGRATTPCHLLVTPVQLHRRNVQRRLREAARPRSSFDFARLVDVARTLNGAARTVTDDEPETETLDRIDRLELMERVLRDDDGSGRVPLERAVGTPATDHVETIERARVSLEMVTGFHPVRLEALQTTIDGLDGAAHADALDLVRGLVSLQTSLTERCDVAVSETELLRIASAIVASDPTVWSEGYPDIETLSVAGISMLTATLEDFLWAVATAETVDVHLHVRYGTGPRIREQLLECDGHITPGEVVR